jgi:hypothetical protein
LHANGPAHHFEAIAHTGEEPAEHAVCNHRAEDRTDDAPDEIAVPKVIPMADGRLLRA